MAAVHVKTVVNPASSANEIVAASVVYLQRVRTDGPMSQVGEWVAGWLGLGGLCVYSAKGREGCEGRSLRCLKSRPSHVCASPPAHSCPACCLPAALRAALQEEWNHASQLRHFSAVRKLDDHPFPAGAPSPHAPSLPCALHITCCTASLLVAHPTCGVVRVSVSPFAPCMLCADAC
jgi:hypothetical protein